MFVPVFCRIAVGSAGDPARLAPPLTVTELEFPVPPVMLALRLTVPPDWSVMLLPVVMAVVKVRLPVLPGEDE